MEGFRENAEITKKENLIKLSKSLSWLLRHGAKKEGVEMSSDGFLYVNDILKHKSFRNYSEDLVKRVVESNDKQRFTLRLCPSSGKLQIRANQGHSIQIEDLPLEPISNKSQVPAVIHGTSRRNWEQIRTNGLSRMSRNHIHFAPAEPGSNEIISGFRSSSEVLIYIDVEKALKDGIQFFRSTNNVILSPGDEKGYISPNYFMKINHL